MSNLKAIIKKIPIVGPVARRLRQAIRPSRPFHGSRDYWVDRYEQGGTSGAGSYQKLAEFKAEFLNAFVQHHSIASVMELGCGDGNQLSLAKYPSYIGYDISPTCIERCRQQFASNPNYTFKGLDEFAAEPVELCLSLDVIYHLVEDEVFHEYMERLFSSATRFVVIYSSDADHVERDQAPHVRHRKFSDWIRTKRPQWELVEHVPNRYPYTGDVAAGSFADFYVYAVR